MGQKWKVNRASSIRLRMKKPARAVDPTPPVGSAAVNAATIAIAAIALVVSLASVYVAMDASYRDRQARAEETDTRCIDAIYIAKRTLFSVLPYGPGMDADSTKLAEPLDYAGMKSIQRALEDAHSRCVSFGVIPRRSTLAESLESQILVPWTAASALPEGSCCDLAAWRIGEMSNVSATLGTALDYVTALPGAPFFPWQERVLPEPDYEPGKYEPGKYESSSE